MTTLHEAMTPAEEVEVLRELISLGYTQEAHSILCHFVKDRIGKRLEYIKGIQSFSTVGNADQAKRERTVLNAWKAGRFTNPEVWESLARASVVEIPFLSRREA
jgi:hypothetical protein